MRYSSSTAIALITLLKINKQGARFIAIDIQLCLRFFC